MGERCEGGMPLTSHKNVTDWARQQEVLGYNIDTESMINNLPERKVDSLHARLAVWPDGRKTATVKVVLVSARTLHQASFVIWP